MPTQINGLPAHILLVHAVIVLVPLAALLVVLSAVWPTARRKIGFLGPLVALGALVFVPVTTNAGEWLEDHLPANPAIARHAALGHMLLPWAAGLFVVSAAVWWLGRRADEVTRAAAPAAPDADGAGASRSTATATALRPATTSTSTRPSWLVIAVAVVAIAVSAGSVVQLYRIGDSGSKAVWGGVIQNK